MDNQHQDDNIGRHLGNGSCLAATGLPDSVEETGIVSNRIPAITREEGRTIPQP